MTIERWLPVVGFEGVYEVSDLGNVRGLDRQLTNRNGVKRVWRGSLIAGIPDHDGYLWVHLANSGTRSRRSIHSLVMGAFVGPRPEGNDVAHGDGNPRNNHLSNLRYCTRSENMMDMVRDGGHHKMEREKCPYGHLLIDANIPPSKKRKGHRACLACDRAKGYLARRKPYSRELYLSVAEGYYKDIMREQ